MNLRYFLAALLILLTVTVLACRNGAKTTAENSASAVSQQKAPITGSKVFRIEAPDRVVIVGSFYEPNKPDSPAVLLLHQWQSDRHSYDEFAKRLKESGFGVLSIDGRGFGESTRKTDGTEIGPERTDVAVKSMLADVNAAFDLLTKQKNVDPKRVGIVGASYGSSLALMYAAGNPQVAAVALLSPGLNYFGSMKTEPAIRKYGDRPLLMVAAGDDLESATAVTKLKAAVNNDKYETTVYEQGGHGTGLFVAKVGLDDQLVSFLTKNLGR
ncbi:MAG: alpha/beta fold hydrolase [Pyrinomonadaceae bacterium]